MKIFHTKNGKIIKVRYTEHVPPDVTARIFWPHEWRDVRQLDGAIGHYIVSDRPMTPEQWIAERTRVAPQQIEAQAESEPATDMEPLGQAIGREPSDME